MKKIEFDEAGNLKVTDKSTAKDREGNDVAQSTQHTIQAAQIGAHLPMFLADMSADELAEANAIIAAQ